MLQFLHPLKAHTPSFSIRLQRRHQCCAHSSENWKTRNQYLFWRSHEESWRKYLEFVVPICQLFWLWWTRFLFGPAVQKEITLCKIGTYQAASLFFLHAHSIDQKNSCHVTHEQEPDKYFGASACWLGLGVCWITHRKQVVVYVGQSEAVVSWNSAYTFAVFVLKIEAPVSCNCSFTLRETSCLKQVSSVCVSP